MRSEHREERKHWEEQTERARRQVSIYIYIYDIGGEGDRQTTNRIRRDLGQYLSMECPVTIASTTKNVTHGAGLVTWTTVAM